MHILLILFLILPDYSFSQDIPDFTFQTLDGMEYSSSSLQNNEVLLIFYFDPFCDVCEDQAEIILKEPYLTTIPIILVTNEGPETTSAFYSKHFRNSTNVKVLMDLDYMFDTWFGYSEAPTILCYNKQHQLTEKFIEKVSGEYLVKALRD